MQHVMVVHGPLAGRLIVMARPVSIAAHVLENEREVLDFGRDPKVSTWSVQQVQVGGKRWYAVCDPGVPREQAVVDTILALIAADPGDAKRCEVPRDDG